MKETNMKLEYNSPAALIVKALTGQTVRYLANKSKVKADGVRFLKIVEVEKVDFGAKSGKRYVTVKALDGDDKGEPKSRNLQLAGIDLIF